MAYKGESDKAQARGRRITFKNSNIYEDGKPTPRELMENYCAKAKKLSEVLRKTPKAHPQRKQVALEYHETIHKLSELKKQYKYNNKTQSDYFNDVAKEALPAEEFKEIMLEARKRWALCK